MEEFILQVSREIGLGGGSECVAFELHRAWLEMSLDARALTSHATETEGQQGIIFAATFLKSWLFGARTRHLATLIAVPLFTLAATLRVWRMRGSKIVLSHGDSLTGDICVVHAVNNASLVEKRRAGYYSWLFNPTNLWVALRDRWMLGGGRYLRIVAVSERVRKQLRQHYQVPDEKIVTIPNGINLARYTPANAQSRAVVRERFGIPQDVPLLLFVGSQFRLKGLEFAIRALTTMETKAWLLVVGGDTAAPFKRLAEQLGVSDRVIFAGPRADLPQIYPAADAFVFPTLYETFALVCLEAMASGLPVLATPVGGIEDYLVDGVNGFHISRDGQDIGARLDRLLNDPELQARFREQGLATVGSYAWPKIATQYLRLFDEVARQKAQGFQGFAPVAKSVSACR